MFDMTGRVALVAGGAGYLAVPACMGLAECGATVVIADFNKEMLDKTVADVAEAGGSAVGIHVDICDEESIRSVVEKTVRDFGRLDVSVNATYAAIGKKVEDLTGDEFDRVNKINITGAFLFARECAARMERGGSIVMFASMYGLVSPDPSIYLEPMNPNPVEYGAGKAAIVQMTKYLAAHYGSRGIRVNAVAPGPFPWDSIQAESPDFVERLSGKTMLGRIGKRHEVAGAVVFLASDAAAYVTGHVLSVDGGWTAW